VRRPEACDARHSTRGRNSSSLQRGSGDYGTRHVYMKRDPGRGAGSLKEPAGAEVRQTYFPSVGRRTRVVISPPLWKRRWGYPGRHVRTRISHPFRLPSMFGGRAVLLPPLAGRS
jgi:hypothetical protein